MKYLLLSILLILGFNANSQYWIQHGSAQTNNMANAIAVDANGNTYSTGYFSGSITFGSISLSSTGIIDMFIVKTSTDGQILWAKNVGGTDVTRGLTIAVNGTHLIVGGFFYDSTTFDTQTIISAGLQDAFIAKYDFSGTLVWAIRAGGNNEDVVNKIAFDNSGNIIATGEYSSTNFISGSVTLGSANNSLDIFTGKFDANGSCQWLKSGTSPYIDRGTQITSDATGNIYVAGEFSDTVTFDLVHNNAMYNALFVIKYNSSGQEQWFRSMGSGNTVKMKGLEINAAGEIIALGNYTSALYSFGFPTNPTLTNIYLNNFFVSKINQAGDLIWSVTDGSNAPVSAECLTIKSNQEIVAGGTYECRFDDFSNNYGAGVFCSLGFSDCFVAGYNQQGNWQYSKCFGGNNFDYLYGLSCDPQNKLAIAGGFTTNIYFPENSANFIGYPAIVDTLFNYCTDVDYYGNAKYTSTGNSDVYIGKPIDPIREVLDFFNRTSSTCIRDFIPFCINQCEDTIKKCGSVPLTANTFTSTHYAPEFHYLWNTNDTVQSITATVSGDYWVTITSYDGCWVDQDTINIVIYPIPVAPTISDSKGINTNAVNPQPIFICLPDSVSLTGNPPPGSTYNWFSFPSGMNPVTVHVSGLYSFTVITADGCQAGNLVQVVASTALPPIVPDLYCPNDTDGNDSITLCLGAPFNMFPFDTISNPYHPSLTMCIPELDHVDWNCNISSVTFSPQSNCFGLMNIFSNVTQTGWYNVSAHIVRKNSCATDSFDVQRSIYVTVNPVPPDSLTIWITGSLYKCPGDSALLHVYGNASFEWAPSLSAADSCYYSAEGTYHVTGSRDSTNSFGCSSHATMTKYFTIVTDSLPQISSIPANALICPFDSVQLISSGTGTFHWYGPNVTINDTDSSIYVTTPGEYWVIRDDGSCILNSPNLEVFQYNTPLLVPLGVGAICNNQPAQMQIITGINSVINWLPPLSGSSLTQTITQPGTYSCIVTACNINTPLSLTFPGSNPVAAIAAPQTLSMCDGDTIQLVSSPFAHYLWTPPGDTNAILNVTDPGNYLLTITDSLGCQDTATANVVVTPNFLETPETIDTTICKGEFVILTATGNTVFHWMDGVHNELDTGRNYNTGMLLNNNYYLVYSDSGGCRSDYDSVNVFIENCDSMGIPNVITPGGDGKNDFFPGLSEHGRLYDITIYNRWGKIIFSKDEDDKGWDGKDNSGKILSDGVYYYTLTVKFISGARMQDKGWIQLIWPEK